MTDNFPAALSVLSRRRALGWFVAGSVSAMATACGAKPVAAGNFPVHHTDAEWRRLLTPKQYYILREQGTERPFSSALLNEHRKGTFACAADGNPLFSSATKFDSGTGWPSFWQPLKGGVGTSTDTSFGSVRTEVHCLQCGGHLGHVFDDGPPPTGKRYCMDGDALRFVPA
ncbi:peptide-methionine (R)-S-oxide reductase MsrB [Novosphingobium sp. FKTRR1]|uniref:peptide-methionine (R)-S-oxide reductase MsrB n=1 Tax=unclassified Novosphingobium TaxID=2644732 RepID=UPI00351D703A